jgi:magnesium transporter
MPELEWEYGYFAGLGIIVSASTFLWWRFRKARWL